MKYTFCNTGSYYQFDPVEKIFPYPNKPPVVNLEYYKELVRQAKKKSVYIMDETGKIIEG